MSFCSLIQLNISTVCNFNQLTAKRKCLKYPPLPEFSKKAEKTKPISFFFKLNIDRNKKIKSFFCRAKEVSKLWANKFSINKIIAFSTINGGAQYELAAASQILLMIYSSLQFKCNHSTIHSKRGASIDFLPTSSAVYCGRTQYSR